MFDSDLQACDHHRYERYEVTGLPVKLRSSAYISTYVVGGVKDIINKFGILPSKWF